MTATATRPGVTALGRKTNALAIRCRNNPADQEAWSELIAAVERIVGYRAGRLTRPNPRYDEDDLRQEGWIGVMRAVSDYDEAWAFSTYVQPWLKNYMMRGRDRVATPTHVPAYVLAEFRRWFAAGRAPDAAMEGLDAGMLCFQELPSTDRDGGTSAPLDARCPTRPEDGPAASAELADDVARLGWAVEQLSRHFPRDAEMFCRYHGIFGRERAIHRELAAEYGVSKNRSHQIVEEATRRIAGLLGVGREGEAA